MSEIKLPGACTICDEMCFEVLAHWDEGEARAGQPKRLGNPVPGSLKITFELYDGTRADMTFCAGCGDKLNHTQYPAIWKKVINSWLHSLDGQVPDWLKKQPGNGILIELNRLEWARHARRDGDFLG